jgi:PAS domain S-box-containing protein
MEENDLYQSLVGLSPDVILVHQEGRIVFLNPAAIKLYKADSVNNLIGTNVLERVHPDSRDEVLQRIGQVDNEDGQLPFMEQKHLCLDGTTVEVEVSGCSVSYKGNPAVQVIV